MRQPEKICGKNLFNFVSIETVKNRVDDFIRFTTRSKEKEYKMFLSKSLLKVFSFRLAWDDAFPVCSNRMQSLFSAPFDFAWKKTESWPEVYIGFGFFMIRIWWENFAVFFFFVSVQRFCRTKDCIQRYYFDVNQ